MNKIFKLFVNENIKTLKKTSTKIMLIISILALFGGVGLTKLIKYTNNMNDEYWLSSGDYKEELKKEINTTKQEIKTKENSVDKQTLNEMKTTLEYYELALENDVDVIYWSKQDWKTEIINNINSINYEIISSGNLLNEEKIKEKEDKKQKYITILKNGDFKAYIEAQKQEEKQKLDNKEITEKEYNDNIYILKLKEKYEIGKTGDKEEEWKQTILGEIQQLKGDLRTNINSTTNKLLKPQEIEEYEEALKIAEYRLQNNMPTIESYSDYRNIYDYMASSFSMVIVAIMVLVIAGGIISTEISKGTVKFLTFTPNKRWKILFAKILSVTVLLIVVTIILAILSNIIGNIIFPNEEVQDYLYVKNGEVKTINHGLYTILYYLATSIDIFVYMIFAIMLSVITRNTAVSVSISIATYIGSGTIMTLINTFITKDWVKFIPFNNLSVVDKIFPNAVSYTMNQLASTYTNNVTLVFSLTVLAVCVFLMIVTMFDSFNKRDIN